MEVNKVGMILIGGLNPVAAVESGIEVENHAMSTVQEIFLRSLLRSRLRSGA